MRKLKWQLKRGAALLHILPSFSILASLETSRYSLVFLKSQNTNLLPMYLPLVINKSTVISYKKVQTHNGVSNVRHVLVNIFNVKICKN